MRTPHASPTMPVPGIHPWVRGDAPSVPQVTVQLVRSLRFKLGYDGTLAMDALKAIVEQKSGGDYTPMLREIVTFFRTGTPPVKPELTLEIYAFMEAADESIRQGGKPISIPDYLRKNGWRK